MARSETHGVPCWYELGTTDLAAAGEFYGAVLGWRIADSGMPGMTYHLASAPDGGGVAGMMPVQGPPGTPPNWLVYFAADDCDAAVAATVAAGGAQLMAPADIPGTGRYAVCADPQGAVFGILQPLPMDTPPEHPAFDQAASGHGNWHELMSPDPAAALAFYSDLFGWTAGTAMDMGEMGTYQIVQFGGADMGGIMGMGNSPVPMWLPYFGVEAVQATHDQVIASGGAITHGPAEVPGGGLIVIATDPQGAFFAVVGPGAQQP